MDLNSQSSLLSEYEGTKDEPKSEEHHNSSLGEHHRRWRTKFILLQIALIAFYTMASFLVFSSHAHNALLPDCMLNPRSINLAHHRY